MRNRQQRLQKIITYGKKNKYLVVVAPKFPEPINGRPVYRLAGSSYYKTSFVTTRLRNGGSAHRRISIRRRSSHGEAKPMLLLLLFMLEHLPLGSLVALPQYAKMVRLNVLLTVWAYIVALVKSDHDGSSDPLDWLRESVPGEPGVDYPVFAEVSDTSFSCADRIFGGKDPFQRNLHFTIIGPKIQIMEASAIQI